MTLTEALALKDREVISLVGGGGKTNLMFALGKELLSYRKGIILTTTTKIWEPAGSALFAIFLSDQFSETERWVKKNIDQHPCLLIAREKLSNGKLQGIPPQWIEEFQSFKDISTIVVEADGAAGRSLKAPREGEPVVPQNTSLLIPVVGVDVLGRPLNEQYVFRSEIAARLLNLSIGSKVTEEVIAALLSEIIKSHPHKARVIPFINKVDIPDGLEKARKLARYLLHIDRGQIERVILGQAQGDPVVKEIIFC
ncbi:MAG: putative selenium-dependent hydroxylase accessory protein YqeC [Deltaproteobacteria bacterium]|nr:putative selenium-dependent hydroxylase accessory protein YqeC [Deltaproteobacteria bacterium]